jgi:lipid II:glycine glycyltransferase (peptidoglycan interpeptide bridge formation enzyme)
MRDRLSVYLARYQNRVIAGFLVLGDTHAAFARCSAHSSPEALAVNAGHALWWRALQDAAAAGCPSFHCGVSWSGDTGLIKWKSGWGGVNQAVQVYVLPIRSRPSDGGAYFEGYGWAKAVWKRLPLPVVDLVGHQVTRWIA